MADEYIELLKEARDALHDAIMASEPGTGWTLHQAYRDLKRSIESKGKEALRTTQEEEDRDRREEKWAAQREARAEWKGLGKPGHQWLALNVLGDDRLTAREVFERVARNLSEGAVYRPDIDRVLKLLLDAREVERVRAPHGKRMLWVYSRRTELDGPIVDLERAFREGEPG